VKFEQAVAAGSAGSEVSFNALIGRTLVCDVQFMNGLIIDILTTDILTIDVLAIDRLIIDTLSSQLLISDALMLVTLGRIRSRTGSSNPIVFNLSIAQVLRLFSHWSHISLI
jgi:hypothetical protein